MELKALKQLIKKGDIPKFLVFAVDEPALAKKYITTIGATEEKPVRYYDTAESVIYEIDTNLREDFIYIVFNDKDIGKQPEYVEKLMGCGRNVILYFSEFDNKHPLNKVCKDNVIYFNRLDENTLTQYLMTILAKHKIAVEQGKIMTLVRYCNCNLGICLNEIDKIMTLEQSNSNLLMDYMLNNGFSDYRQVNMFKTVDKILGCLKNGTSDIEVLQDIQKMTDSPVVVLYNLYTASRRALLNSRADIYAYVMKLCMWAYNGVIDGTMSERYILPLVIARIIERDFDNL